MPNEPVLPDLADDNENADEGVGGTWVPAMAVVHCSVAVPTEEAARALADELKARGHRWITAIRLDQLTRLPKADHLIQRKTEFTDPALAGWWHVGSLVDERAPAGDAFGFIDMPAEFFQQECERAAVEALARSHGGFAGAGWSSLREATFPGPAPYAPAPELFDLNGLIHQPERDHAHAVRRSVIAGFPPVPELPLTGEKLSYGREKRRYPPLLDSIRQVAGRLPAGDEPPRKPWEAFLAGGIVAAWRAAEDADFEDESDVASWLGQSVVYQDVCSPHSVEAVPLLAGIAALGDVRPAHRVQCLVRLFEAATFGERRAATEADRRHASGLPVTASPDEQAVRLAVEAAAPGLAERPDQESEAVRFVLTALAAAHAEDEPEALAAVVDTCRDRTDPRPREVPSPYAPARGALLQLLWEQVRAV